MMLALVPEPQIRRELDVFTRPELLFRPYGG